MDRCGLDEIATQRRDLVGKARSNKLIPEDYAGGVFTVSNLGGFAIDQFVAVVQPGEAGILAVGRIVPTVVADGDAHAIRQMMSLTLSADHRVVDGADGAYFLQAVKDALEAPETLDT